MSPDPAQDHTLYLYFLPSDTPRLDDLRRNGHALLSPEERARLDDFTHPKRADQFFLGRVLMRRCLAIHTGLAAGALEIELGPNGKPALSDRHDTGIVFSLSHNRDTAVFAIAEAEKIGVDLELTSRAPTVAKIARKFFTPGEARRLEGAGDDAERDAMALWTLKESIVKAEGGTIWAGLSGVELEFGQDSIRWLSPPPTGRADDWFLASGRHGTDSSIAVALQRIDGVGQAPSIAAATLGSEELKEDCFKVTRATPSVTTRSGSD